MVRFQISRTFSCVTGDKCEIVRSLLEPRVYLRPKSFDFLRRIFRKGENSLHLKRDKVNLNQHIFDKKGGTRVGGGGGGAYFWVNIVMKCGFSNKS